MLEAAISDLTAAIKLNNDLLNQVLSRADTQRPSNTPAAEDQPRRRGRPPKGEEAPVEVQQPEPEPPVEAKSAEPEPEPEPAPAPAAAKPDADDLSDERLRDLFGGYIGSAADEADRDGRKSFVRAILDNFGAAKITLLPQENRAQAVQWLRDHMAGKTVNMMVDDDDDLTG